MESCLISINLIAMWKQFVKDYLQFSRKDRVAVLVLLSLIFIILLLPAIWPVRRPQQPSAQQIAGIKEQADRLNKETPKDTAEGNDNYNFHHRYDHVKKIKFSGFIQAVLF